MRVLLSSSDAVGGYVLLVAEQLERLGHEARIDTPGDQDFDVIFAQDAASAFELARLLPTAPSVLAIHSSAVRSGCTAPQLPGLTAAITVTDEHAQRRAHALAERCEVLRLREPVDVGRWGSRPPAADPSDAVVLLDRSLGGHRSEQVAAACAELGLATTQTGEAQLEDADIVVGCDRSIVEAMAAGCAAYVCAPGGGWVTVDRYPALEADGFGRGAPAEPPSHERLVSELARYRPDMGAANRELAIVHHDAGQHVEALAELFQRLAPRSAPLDAPLREMSRLVRLLGHAEAERESLREQLRRARGERRELVRRHREELARLRRELDELRSSWRVRSGRRLARLRSRRGVERGPTAGEHGPAAAEHGPAASKRRPPS